MQHDQIFHKLCVCTNGAVRQREKTVLLRARSVGLLKDVNLAFVVTGEEAFAVL